MIPSFESFKVYSYVEAALDEVIDWETVSYNDYMVYYSGNQSKTKYLTVTLTPTPFELTNPSLNVYAPAGVRFDLTMQYGYTMNAIWDLTLLKRIFPLLLVWLQSFRVWSNRHSVLHGVLMILEKLP